MISRNLSAHYRNKLISTICDKKKWPTHYFTLIYFFPPFPLYQCCFWSATVSTNIDLGEGGTFCQYEVKIQLLATIFVTDCSYTTGKLQKQFGGVYFCVHIRMARKCHRSSTFFVHSSNFPCDLPDFL